MHISSLFFTVIPSNTSVFVVLFFVVVFDLHFFCCMCTVKFFWIQIRHFNSITISEIMIMLWCGVLAGCKCAYPVPYYNSFVIYYYHFKLFKLLLHCDVYIVMLCLLVVKLTETCPICSVFTVYYGESEGLGGGGGGWLWWWSRMEVRIYFCHRFIVLACREAESLDSSSCPWSDIRVYWISM